MIPVTKADKVVDVIDPSYIPLNDLDKKNWEWCKSTNRSPSGCFTYLTFCETGDPEAYDGAPVGLQIVARKYEEEKVWAIARMIDAILRKSGKVS